MAAPINHTLASKDWGIMVLLAIIWGSSYYFVQQLLNQGITPFVIVWVRLIFALGSIWVMLFVMKQEMPYNKKVWGAFFVAGLLNNLIPFSLIVWGQTQVGSALASILNATTPLFTAVLAGSFLKDEKITKEKIVGTVVGFFGVVVLLGPSVLSGLSSDIVAHIALLGAALSYAFAGIFGRRFAAMGVAPMATATGQITCSTALLTPLIFLFQDPSILLNLSLESWISVLCLSVVSTTLAYILFYKILATAGASNLMLVAFLIPITGVLLGHFVLNEYLGIQHILGMLLIGAGMAVIDGRIWEKFIRV